MNRIIAATLILFAFACGAPDEGFEDEEQLELPDGVELGTLKQALLTNGLAFRVQSHSESTTTQTAQLAQAGACAVGRWNTALHISGLSFVNGIGSTGADHYIQGRNSGSMGGRVGWTLGSSWNNTTVRILNTLNFGDMCDVLVHEIGSHVMRQLNDSGHITSPDNNAFDAPVNLGNPVFIYPTNMSLVCLVRQCNDGVWAPEAF